MTIRTSDEDNPAPLQKNHMISPNPESSDEEFDESPNFCIFFTPFPITTESEISNLIYEIRLATSQPKVEQSNGSFCFM